MGNIIDILIKVISTIFVCAVIFSCQPKKEIRKVTPIFKFGFKTNSFSTGPLNNSGFIFKLQDTIPLLFLTAHHTVAGTGRENVYLKWDSLKDATKNICLWNMQDKEYEIYVSNNLPVPYGETLKLDVSAFYLSTDTVPFIIPAKKKAERGDTVNLFSRIVYNSDTTFLNPAIVIYETDSVMVYELLNFKVAQIMSGTSGSPVINSRGELVSNSYGGLTLPDEEEKKKITKQFPFISKFPLQVGKTYGIGVPVKWIEQSLTEAIRSEKQRENNQ